MYESLQSLTFFTVFVFFSFSVFWYHILTGVRHLFMDFFHLGESLKGSYYSSIFVLCLWLVSTIGFFGHIYLWKAQLFGLYKDIAL